MAIKVVGVVLLVQLLLFTKPISAGEQARLRFVEQVKSSLRPGVEYDMAFMESFTQTLADHDHDACAVGTGGEGDHAPPPRYYFPPTDLSAYTAQDHQNVEKLRKQIAEEILPRVNAILQACSGREELDVTFFWPLQVLLKFPAPNERHRQRMWDLLVFRVNANDFETTFLHLYDHPQLEGEQSASQDVSEVEGRTGDRILSTEEKRGQQEHAHGPFLGDLLQAPEDGDIVHFINESEGIIQTFIEEVKNSKLDKIKKVSEYNFAKKEQHRRSGDALSTSFVMKLPEGLSSAQLAVLRARGPFVREEQLRRRHIVRVYPEAAALLFWDQLFKEATSCEQQMGLADGGSEGAAPYGYLTYTFRKASFQLRCKRESEHVDGALLVHQLSGRTTPAGRVGGEDGDWTSFGLSKTTVQFEYRKMWQDPVRAEELKALARGGDEQKNIMTQPAAREGPGQPVARKEATRGGAGEGVVAAARPAALSGAVCIPVILNSTPSGGQPGGGRGQSVMSKYDMEALATALLFSKRYCDTMVASANSLVVQVGRDLDSEAWRKQTLDAAYAASSRELFSEDGSVAALVHEFLQKQDLAATEAERIARIAVRSGDADANAETPDGGTNKWMKGGWKSSIATSRTAYRVRLALERTEKLKSNRSVLRALAAESQALGLTYASYQPVVPKESNTSTVDAAVSLLGNELEGLSREEVLVLPEPMLRDLFHDPSVSENAEAEQRTEAEGNEKSSAWNADRKRHEFTALEQKLLASWADKFPKVAKQDDQSEERPAFRYSGRRKLLAAPTTMMYVFNSAFAAVAEKRNEKLRKLQSARAKMARLKEELLQVNAYIESDVYWKHKDILAQNWLQIDEEEPDHGSEKDRHAREVREAYRKAIVKEEGEEFPYDDGLMESPLKTKTDRDGKNNAEMIRERKSTDPAVWEYSSESATAVEKNKNVRRDDLANAWRGRTEADEWKNFSQKYMVLDHVADRARLMQSGKPYEKCMLLVHNMLQETARVQRKHNAQLARDTRDLGAVLYMNDNSLEDYISKEEVPRGLVDPAEDENLEHAELAPAAGSYSDGVQTQEGEVDDSRLQLLRMKTRVVQYLRQTYRKTLRRNLLGRGGVKQLLVSTAARRATSTKPKQSAKPKEKMKPGAARKKPLLAGAAAHAPGAEADDDPRETTFFSPGSGGLYARGGMGLLGLSSAAKQRAAWGAAAGKGRVDAVIENSEFYTQFLDGGPPIWATPEENRKRSCRPHVLLVEDRKYLDRYDVEAQNPKSKYDSDEHDGSRPGASLRLTGLYAMAETERSVELPHHMRHQYMHAVVADRWKLEKYGGAQEKLKVDNGTAVAKSFLVAGGVFVLDYLNHRTLKRHCRLLAETMFPYAVRAPPPVFPSELRRLQKEIEDESGEIHRIVFSSNDDKQQEQGEERNYLRGASGQGRQEEPTLKQQMDPVLKLLKELQDKLADLVRKNDAKNNYKHEVKISTTGRGTEDKNRTKDASVPVPHAGHEETAADLALTVDENETTATSWFKNNFSGKFIQQAKDLYELRNKRLSAEGNGRSSLESSSEAASALDMAIRLVANVVSFWETHDYSVVWNNDGLPELVPLTPEGYTKIAEFSHDKIRSEIYPTDPEPLAADGTETEETALWNLLGPERKSVAKWRRLRFAREHFFREKMRETVQRNCFAPTLEWAKGRSLQMHGETSEATDAQVARLRAMDDPDALYSLRAQNIIEGAFGDFTNEEQRQLWTQCQRMKVHWDDVFSIHPEKAEKKQENLAARIVEVHANVLKLEREHDQQRGSARRVVRIATPFQGIEKLAELILFGRGDADAQWQNKAEARSGDSDASASRGQYSHKADEVDEPVWTFGDETTSSEKRGWPAGVSEVYEKALFPSSVDALDIEETAKLVFYKYLQQYSRFSKLVRDNSRIYLRNKKKKFVNIVGTFGDANNLPLSLRHLAPGANSAEFLDALGTFIDDSVGGKGGRHTERGQSSDAEPVTPAALTRLTQPLPRDFIISDFAEIPHIFDYFRTEKYTYDEEERRDQQPGHAVVKIAKGALQLPQKLYKGSTKLLYDVVSGVGLRKAGRMFQKLEKVVGKPMLRGNNAAEEDIEKMTELKEGDRDFAEEFATQNSMRAVKAALQMDPADADFDGHLVNECEGEDEESLQRKLSYRWWRFGASLKVCLHSVMGRLSPEKEAKVLAGQTKLSNSYQPGKYASRGDNTDDYFRIGDRMARARADEINSLVSEMEDVDKSFYLELHAGLLFRNDATKEIESLKNHGRKKSDAKLADSKERAEAEAKAARGWGRNKHRKVKVTNRTLILTVEELFAHIDLTRDKLPEHARLWEPGTDPTKMDKSEYAVRRRLPEVSQDAVCRTFHRNVRGVLQGDSFLAEVSLKHHATEMNSSDPKGNDASEAIEWAEKLLDYQRTDAEARLSYFGNKMKGTNGLRDLLPAGNSFAQSSAALDTKQRIVEIARKYRFVRLVRDSTKAKEFDKIAARDQRRWFFLEGSAEGIKTPRIVHVREFETGRFGAPGKRSLQRFVTRFFFLPTQGSGSSADEDNSMSLTEDDWRFAFPDWLRRNVRDKADILKQLKNDAGSPLGEFTLKFRQLWNEDKSEIKRMPLLRVIDGLEDGFVHVADLLLIVTHKFVKKYTQSYRDDLKRHQEALNVAAGRYRAYETGGVGNGDVPTYTPGSSEVAGFLDDAFEEVYQDLRALADNVVGGRILDPLWAQRIEYAVRQQVKAGFLDHTPVRILLAFKHYRGKSDLGAGTPGGEAKNPRRDVALDEPEEESAVLADAHTYGFYDFVEFPNRDMEYNPENLEESALARAEEVLRSLARVELVEEELREFQGAIEESLATAEEELQQNTELLNEEEDAFYGFMWRSHALAPYGFFERRYETADLVARFLQSAGLGLNLSDAAGDVEKQVEVLPSGRYPQTTTIDVAVETYQGEDITGGTGVIDVAPRSGSVFDVPPQSLTVKASLGFRQMTSVEQVLGLLISELWRTDNSSGDRAMREAKAHLAQERNAAWNLSGKKPRKVTTQGQAPFLDPDEPGGGAGGANPNLHMYDADASVSDDLGEQVVKLETALLDPGVVDPHAHGWVWPYATTATVTDDFVLANIDRIKSGHCLGLHSSTENLDGSTLPEQYRLQEERERRFLDLVNDAKNSLKIIVDCVNRHFEGDAIEKWIDSVELIRMGILYEHAGSSSTASGSPPRSADASTFSITADPPTELISDFTVESSDTQGQDAGRPPTSTKADAADDQKAGAAGSTRSDNILKRENAKPQRLKLRMVQSLSGLRYYLLMDQLKHSPFLRKETLKAKYRSHILNSHQVDELARVEKSLINFKTELNRSFEGWLAYLNLWDSNMLGPSSTVLNRLGLGIGRSSATPRSPAEAKAEERNVKRALAGSSKQFRLLNPFPVKEMPKQLELQDVSHDVVALRLAMRRALGGLQHLLEVFEDTVALKSDSSVLLGVPLLSAAGGTGTATGTNANRRTSSEALQSRVEQYDKHTSLDEFRGKYANLSLLALDVLAKRPQLLSNLLLHKLRLMGQERLEKQRDSRKMLIALGSEDRKKHSSFGMVGRTPEKWTEARRKLGDVVFEEVDIGVPYRAFAEQAGGAVAADRGAPPPVRPRPGRAPVPTVADLLTVWAAKASQASGIMKKSGSKIVLERLDVDLLPAQSELQANRSSNKTKSDYPPSTPASTCESITTRRKKMKNGIKEPGPFFAAWT
eukprot:g269.t1